VQSAFPSTIQGKIQQFSYGREGEVTGLMLSNSIQVNVSPALGDQMAVIAKPPPQPRFA